MTRQTSARCKVLMLMVMWRLAEAPSSWSTICWTVPSAASFESWPIIPNCNGLGWVTDFGLGGMGGVNQAYLSRGDQRRHWHR